MAKMTATDFVAWLVVNWHFPFSNVLWLCLILAFYSAFCRAVVVDSASGTAMFEMLLKLYRNSLKQEQQLADTFEKRNRNFTVSLCAHHFLSGVVRKRMELAAVVIVVFPGVMSWGLTCSVLTGYTFPVLL